MNYEHLLFLESNGGCMDASFIYSSIFSGNKNIASWTYQVSIALLHNDGIGADSRAAIFWSFNTHIISAIYAACYLSLFCIVKIIMLEERQCMVSFPWFNFRNL